MFSPLKENCVFTKSLMNLKDPRAISGCLIPLLTITGRIAGVHSIKHRFYLYNVETRREGRYEKCFPEQMWLLNMDQ